MKNFFAFLLSFLLAQAAFNAPPAHADYWEKNRCPIAAPKPVLENGSFKLDAEKGIAQEESAIGQGVKLRIESGGCEYRGVSYKFTFDDKPAAIKVVGAEYRKAAALLEALEKAYPKKFGFSREKKALETYLGVAAEPRLEERLYIKPPDDTQFHETVSVAGDLDGKPAYIEIRVSSGPY